MKDYNFIINDKIFLDQPVKNNIRIHEYTWKIATGQEHDYWSAGLLENNYFKKYHKVIVIDLSKQRAVDTGPKAIQQTNFTGNLESISSTFFIIEEAKKLILNFSREIMKVFLFFLFFLFEYKMTQNSTLNVTLSNSQLNKLKSGIENGTEVTLYLSSNMISDLVILLMRLIFRINYY